MAWIDIKDLPESVLGRLIVIGALQDTRNLFQRGDFLCNRVAIDDRKVLNKFEPFGHCVADLSAVLEHPAKIDVARMEIRLQADAFFEGIYCAGLVAKV